MEFAEIQPACQMRKGLETKAAVFLDVGLSKLTCIELDHLDGLGLKVQTTRLSHLVLVGCSLFSSDAKRWKYPVSP